MPIPSLLDYIDIVEGFPPVDLDAGANTGDYVSLKNYGGCLVMFHSGIGTAGQDPILVLQQASDVAGTGVKDLNFTIIFRKQAATNLAAVSVWTKTTQTAATSYTEATAAEQSALWVVDVKASDLDVANGFDCIRATVADVGGAAQPGSLHYILYSARIARGPVDKISAIGN